MATRLRPLLALRASLFYLGYGLLTFWFSVSGWLLSWVLPFKWCNSYMVSWNHCVLTWLRLTCGVQFRVLGPRPLPAPAVILANHQSQWETFCLQTLAPTACPVLKRELLQIPFFGWGLKLLKPIAIDRGNPKQAIRQIAEQGLERLGEGRPIILYPEGTRHNNGKLGKFARGGPSIAIQAGAPIVPVAHNAGRCWPADRFLKYPGLITVVVGEPIDPAEGDSRQLTERVRGWIEAQLDSPALAPDAALSSASAPHSA